MMTFDRFARRAATAAVAGLLAAASAGGSAQAANWLQKNFYLSGPNYDGDVPSCEAALGTISDRFETKESRFWNSNAQILGYERVRQVAFLPWARGTMPRRFCRAVAELNDGRKHVVNYYLTEDGGEIGATWGVTWCVVGYDRNMAYSPSCKMARP